MLIIKKELKEKLEKVFRESKNQDTLVEVDGEMYIYSTIRNELRRHVNQNGQEIEYKIGCYLPDMKTLVTFREEN